MTSTVQTGVPLAVAAAAYAPSARQPSPKKVEMTVQTTVKRETGFEWYLLKTSGGSYSGTTFLNLSLSGGTLHCCGMGTMGSFSVYVPHRVAIGQGGFRMPTAMELREYVRVMMTGSWAYPEFLGVVGPTQQGKRELELLKILLDYEEIHKTTNKNYAPDRTPMMIIKVNKNNMLRRWGLLNNLGEYDTRGSDAGIAGQEYQQWLEANNLIAKV